MKKITNEQSVARLRYYKEQLKSAELGYSVLGYSREQLNAQIFQEIEEDEDIKEVLNVNIVFYKDMNYRWQYEIRLIIDECMFSSNNRKEINLYETKTEAQKECAKHLIELLDYKISEIKDLW